MEGENIISSEFNDRYPRIQLINVDDLEGDDDYIINSNKAIEECFVLKVNEYRILRSNIFDRLLSFYTRLDYRDADWIHKDLAITATIGYHCCTYVFNIEEWYDYKQSGEFDDKIQKYINWGKWCYERTLGAGFKAIAPRMKAETPRTKNTVIKK